MPAPKTDDTESAFTYIEEQLEQALADLKVIKSAFPEDEFGNVDTLGHRRYHEEMITAARAQTKFWEELRRDLIKKGLMWGLLAVIGLAVTGLAVKTGISWNVGE
jgi:hypothetical protein